MDTFHQASGQLTSKDQHQQPPHHQQHHQTQSQTQSQTQPQSQTQQQIHHHHLNIHNKALSFRSSRSPSATRTAEQTFC